jgi:hypothetical protein
MILLLHLALFVLLKVITIAVIISTTAGCDCRVESFSEAVLTFLAALIIVAAVCFSIFFANSDDNPRGGDFDLLAQLLLM